MLKEIRTPCWKSATEEYSKSEEQEMFFVVWVYVGLHLSDTLTCWYSVPSKMSDCQQHTSAS